MRRAQAYKELKKFQDGLEDVEQALKLAPKDKDAARLKQELLLAKEQQAKADKLLYNAAQNKEKDASKPSEAQPEKESKKEGEETEGKKTETKENKEVNVIDAFCATEKPSKEVMEDIFNLFRKDQDSKIYANERNFAKKLANLIKRDDTDREIYLLAIVFFQDNPIYIDQFFKSQAPTHLFKKLETKAEKVVKNPSDIPLLEGFFQEMEEICEVFLNITENEKGRILLRDQPYLEGFLDQFYPLIMKNLRHEKEAVASYFGLITNFCVISPKFSKYFEKKYLDQMLEPLCEKIFRSKRQNYNRVKESLYGFIANLVREPTIRQKFSNDSKIVNDFYKYLIQSLDSFPILNTSNLKWIRSVENILAIFINVVFGIPDDLKKQLFIDKLRVSHHVRRFMSLSLQKMEYGPIVLRAVQLLSKFEFDPSFVEGHKDIIVNSWKEHFTKEAKEFEITNHAIRIYTRWFLKFNGNGLKKYFSADDLKPLIENCITILKESDEERFANTSMLAGNIAEIYPECSDSFQECIPLLLEICQNKMGVMRKNAAICVAQLSKTPRNLEVIRQNHGIEILASISKFVLEK